MSALRRCLAAVRVNIRPRACRWFALTVDEHAVEPRHRRARDKTAHSVQPPFLRDDRIEDDVPNLRSSTPKPAVTAWSRPPYKRSSRRSAGATLVVDRGTFQSSRSTQRQPTGEFVYGFHPVVAALQANKRQVHRVFLQADKDTAAESTAATSSSTLHRESEKQQLHAAIQRYIPQLSVEYIDRQQLNLLSEDRPHNGVVIDASPLQPPLSDTLPTAASMHVPAGGESAAAALSPLWLLLDEVQDPQNLGAIVRSAAFFGAAGVVLCKKNCAPLSPVASKASSGCLETLDVRWCKSTMRLLDDAKQAGWRLVGLSAEEVSEAKRVRDCRQFAVSGPTVLVVGNEGRGLRTLVRQSCDELLSIRGSDGVAGAAGEVAESALLDSLNVSTAVAIALYQCSNKRPSTEDGR